MENYIREMVDICKLPFKEINNDFKVVQIGRSVIYISNYKKIIDYSDNKIVLKIKGNTLEIEGCSLQISQMNKNEIIIKGVINKFGMGIIDEEK